MNTDIAIKVENITKKYRLYKNKKDRLIEALNPFQSKLHTDFYSLKGINLTVKKGDIVGILGKNGSGKSTLMKLIAGVATPTGGKVTTRGNLLPLLELGSGFHPEFSGLENIYFYTSLLGYGRWQINEIIEEVINFASLGEYLNQPFRTYSSGMKARLAFSVSIHVDPDILILDEILSVGDEEFKEKSGKKMREFFEKGKTILFVSHSMPSIEELCSRAIILDKGELILDTDTALAVKEYRRLVRLSNTLAERQAIRNEIIEMNNAATNPGL
jgi:lipopolysaccharide transport system ATP-binding protein